MGTHTATPATVLLWTAIGEWSGGVTGGPTIHRRTSLERLPAVVVLERLPVPALAMARDGIILFANTAFAEMVGYEQDALAGSPFPEIFQTVPAEVAAFSGVDAVTNLVVELRHCEGWTVRARMSNSAMMRRDDPVVLVTFDNLTEQLWFFFFFFFPLIDVNDLPIGLIDLELSMPPTELVGDTAAVLLRPEQGPPAAVLKVARGPLRAAELRTQRRVLAELAIHPRLDDEWRQLLPRILALTSAPMRPYP